jgi:hypothetical protein
MRNEDNMNADQANNTDVLITKHLANETTSDEQKEVQHLVTTDNYTEKEFNSQKQTYFFLKNFLHLKKASEQAEGEIPAPIMQKLMEKQKAYFNNQSSAPIKLSFADQYITPYKFAWAAVLLIAVVVGATFFYSYQKESQIIAKQSLPTLEIGILSGSDIEQDLTGLKKRYNVQVVEFDSPEALQTWIQESSQSQSVRVWKDAQSGQFMSNGRNIQGTVENNH